MRTSRLSRCQAALTMQRLHLLGARQAIPALRCTYQRLEHEVKITFSVKEPGNRLRPPLFDGTPTARFVARRSFESRPGSRNTLSDPSFIVVSSLQQRRGSSSSYPH
jgi:hypothetical protein